MWLFQAAERRRQPDDLWLGGSTAVVAGVVNVCSVMMFFAFSSNVTGHVAAFAEQMLKGHWYQVLVLLGWMLMFLSGAFLASLSVTKLGSRNVYGGHGAPVLVEAALLWGVGFYGHRHYGETLWETELLVAVLLFAMGIQNGTVTAVSNAVVRTTHLTGLFTDLAMELALVAQRRYRSNPKLAFRLKLRSTILCSYVLGGLFGGAACMLVGFRALYLGCAVLLLILVRDVFLAFQLTPSVSRAEPVMRTSTSGQHSRVSRES